MRRLYKDFTIQTVKTETDLGNGIKAIFYIAKTNGTKARIQEYTAYDEKNHLRVIERVQKIIDCL